MPKLIAPELTIAPDSTITSSPDSHVGPLALVGPHPYASHSRVSGCHASHSHEPHAIAGLNLAPLFLGVCLALAVPMATPAAAQNGDLRGVITDMAESMLNQEMDNQAYREARQANTISAYRDYLRRFPRGVNAANAEQALARLGDNQRPPILDNNMSPIVPYPGGNVANVAAENEAALRLGRSQRILVQEQLTRVGYNTGGSDGLWGRNTRNAISRWQGDNKLAATGYVTADQLQLLQRQAGRGQASNPVPGTANGVNPQLEENLLELSRAERREIQQRLTRLGYNTRGADGAFGRNTRTAIRTWQGDQGDSATGYITADQLRELRQQSRG